MLSHVVSSSNAISTVFSILVAGEFCNDWGMVLGGTTVFHSDVYSEYVLICEKEYTNSTNSAISHHDILPFGRTGLLIYSSRSFQPVLMPTDVGKSSSI